MSKSCWFYCAYAACVFPWEKFGLPVMVVCIDSSRGRVDFFLTDLQTVAVSLISKLFFSGEGMFFGGVCSSTPKFHGLAMAASSW